MSNDVKGTPIIKGLGFDSFGLGSNACTVDIDEENDKIIRIRPFHFDEHQTPEELNAWKIEARGHVFEPGFKTHMSPLSLCYKKRVYSKNRIPYPMASATPRTAGRLTTNASPGTRQPRFALPR